MQSQTSCSPPRKHSSAYPLNEANSPNNCEKSLTCEGSAVPALQSAGSLSHSSGASTLQQIVCRLSKEELREATLDAVP